MSMNMKTLCCTCQTKPATKLCSKCRNRPYCGRECQLLDWKVHKLLCNSSDTDVGVNATLPLTNEQCGRCHSLETAQKCKHCPRQYCTKECLVKNWFDDAHRFYCCRSGEVGRDFEIKAASDKEGFGIFALRDFKLGEIVIAEKPVLLFRKEQGVAEELTESKLSHLPFSTHNAVKNLHPTGGTLNDKFSLNRMGCGELQSGLLITMSRVNHDCIGNSSHRYVPERGVVLLQAKRDIRSGEEITFSYVPNENNRQPMLQLKYGFTCHCVACTDSDVDCKLKYTMQLNKSIFGNLKTLLNENPDAIISGIKELVSLYDQLDYGPQYYCSEYHVMFMAMMWAKKPLEECVKVARQANHYAELWYEDCEAQLHNSRKRALDPEGYFAERTRGHV